MNPPPSYLLSLLICFCTIYILPYTKPITPLLIDVTSKYLTFEQFQTLYQKKYASPAEASLRKLAYETNVKNLLAQNCSACGVTPMFDKTEQQLSSRFFFNKVINGVRLNDLKFTDPAQIKLPQTTKARAKKSLTSQPITATSLDWRTQKIVTPIRDQENCGSCWAFATCAYFEAYMVRNKLQTLSIDLAEQELLECDIQSAGCNGGSSVTASNYVLKNGMPPESAEIYKAARYYNNLCGDTNLYTFAPSLTFKTYFNSRRMSDTAIISLLTVQPLNIYLTASTWYMYSPANGNDIFKCNSIDSTKYQRMNHAVLLVGYGPDYWLVKNSWGTSFGLDGYMKISRNVKENCGIGFFVGYV